MKKIIALTIIGLSSFSAIAQQAPQKSFSEKLDGISTSENELTKSAKTDNSSVGQSGVMTTSVSLITVSSRTMSFPLELNYSSGIKVDQRSSSVGLGWAMPIGSITRDYGAFEPDYSSVQHEGDMKHWNSGQNGFLNPAGNGIDPSDHNQSLGYNTLVPENQRTMPLSDFYHVSVPGMKSNSFWNGASIGSSHVWNWNEFENWRVEHTTKTFQIDQEFSRINELNLQIPAGQGGQTTSPKDWFAFNSSYAAAIGVLPYVINGEAHLPSSSSNDFNPSQLERTVKYEDFEQFTITDEAGTRYVFGRALRGQKFVFQDDPYWSSQKSEMADAANGNFWKIDYIAEWLITEILSADYEDLNNNGIADDGDAGDWIRFEYTAPEKTVQSIPVGSLSTSRLNSVVPTHREWSSFSQTDQASSLMRERAYLTHIFTPTQKLDFTISQRFDVEHDYYSKPANKIGEDYFFEDRQYGSQGTSSDFDIIYPVETMKYDSIKVFSRLIDKAVYPNEEILTGAIVLNYAEKGSADELAVSEFLIRDNNNEDKLIDTPSTTSGFDIMAYKSSRIKRGKTTLLSIDFLGGDLSNTEKVSYEFEYAYNPSFDEIHKREIVRKYSSPSLRTRGGSSPYSKSLAHIDYVESKLNSNGVSYSQVNHNLIVSSMLSPDEFLIDFPYIERYYKLDIPAWNATNYVVNYGQTSNFDGSSYPIISEDIPHALTPIQDVYGYLYAENCTECPKAWSLTKIKYPSGGVVSFEYELGEFDKSIDEPNWNLTENGIPIIENYNRLAKKRSYVQAAYNQYALEKGADGFGPGNNQLKTLTATFEVGLPSSYGIRLRSKTINDRVNATVQIDYEYENGHFTSLPSEYVQSYVGAFNSFIKREMVRHRWEKGNYGSGTSSSAIDYLDYEMKMKYAAISGIALDEYTSTHFYEKIDERFSDGSFRRMNYAPIHGQTIIDYEEHYLFSHRLASGSWDGRYILAKKNLDVAPISMLKTEYFDANDLLQPYKVMTSSYSRIPFGNGHTMDFDYTGGIPSNPNSILLWGFNTEYEIWVPITQNYHAQSYNYDSWLNLWYVGAISIPNSIPGFAFVQGTFVNDTAEIPNSENPYMSYERWQSFKTTLDKTTTDYKGLVSEVQYTYDNRKRIIEEKSSNYGIAEEFITEYEYADVSYSSSVPNLFVDKNILSARTRTTQYLNTISSDNVVSSSVVTYDLDNFSIPRQLSSYSFEAQQLSSEGIIPQGVYTDFDFYAPSNPNWRRTESDVIEYNKGGQVISSRTNRLFSKSVMGNGLNLQKAAISNPYSEFDATYSGFEDFNGVHTFSNWTNEDYKNEDWFIEGEASQDEPAVSWRVPSNPCNNPIPQGENQPYIRELNHVLIDNLSALQVGDPVKIELIGSSAAMPSGYSFSIETAVSSIVYIGPGTNNPTYVKDYALCVSDPIVFPEATSTQYTGVATVTGLDGNLIVLEVEEDAQRTIYETKVTKLGVEFSLSNRYARTGKYSYRMPTRREAGAEFEKTPVRPVKLSASPSNSSPLSCPNTPPVPNVNNFCQWSYEASVWLKYDYENRLSADNPPLEVKSADALADGIYKRGTVTTTNNNEGVVIVCDIYDQSRTTILETKRFYVEEIDNDWKQYTIEIPSSRDANKWLDVYVVNERSQLGLVALKDYKSLYADDILIYPTGSKYSYSVFDKFGNSTYSVNNNDVFVSSSYDEKGRVISQKNAYGTVTNALEYFESQNWVGKDNHVTLTNWVDNGVPNKTRKYVDGFGKTTQVMAVDYARNARIVSETNFYGDKGFLTASFKPYVLSGTVLEDKHNSNFYFEVQDFYESSNAFTGMSYEAKPEKVISSMVSPREDLESPIVSSQMDYVSTVPLIAPFGLTAATQNYPAGNLLVHQMQNPNGDIVRTYLDGNGRVILEEHEIGQNHVQNSDGSISLTSGNSISQTWFVYDPAGHLVKVVDPSGKESQFFYNSLGVLIKEITPDKGTSELRYDKYGQVRFVRDQKDINANVNAFGTDQFMYSKYDEWGRIIESGQIMAATSNPPFTGQTYFDNYTVINNQDFPSNSIPLKQAHQAFNYDGSREQFDSDALLGERVYSNHVMDATFFYTPIKTDIKSFKYMADGQLAECSYSYDGLDKHKMVFNYNGMRLPIGKKYIHPNNSQFDFEWKTELDNFGRAKVNSSVYYGVEKVTGTYKYDLFGNLLLKGLGETGNSSNPSVDYVSYRQNIRNQITSQMSNNFRFGLQYDPNGNITDQFWSNEEFDPTNGSNLAINQYHYYYDKMNRLIGADYLEGTLAGAPSPFGYFNSIYSSIGNDFNCVVNPQVVNDYFLEKIETISKNIPEDKNSSLELEALNALNLLISNYKDNNVSWQAMTENEQEHFLNGYIDKLHTSRIPVNSYELYEAEYQKDYEHRDLVKQQELYPSIMKYTKLIMSGIPFTPSVDCDPNINATVYGFLPSFPVPSTMNNTTKYDAAYWYTRNGNTTQLNRNDQFGVKTVQNYVYSNPANNQLSQVNWTTNSSTSSFGYQYDANGNLFEDLRNDVSNIAYNTFNDLPTSITNSNGQKRYRYNAQGQRIMKEVSGNDMEYYMDGVIVDELGDVKSYAIPEGYVEPNLPLEKVDYYFVITDWLGTTRSVIDENGAQLNAVDHYPFGLRMPDRNSYTTGQEGQRYQFTGHEYDGETGYDYHGARYYNRELGRYMSVDPLAKKFFGWSTYNYTLGNPINLIDPTGMGPEDIGIYTVNTNGKINWIKTVESEENYDIVYTAEDWTNGKYYADEAKTKSSGIRLNDQGIMPTLKSKDYGPTYDKKDLFVAFEFLIQNSDVEWGASGFIESDKSTVYVLQKGDENEVTSAVSVDAIYGKKNKTFDLHSHPRNRVDAKANRPSGGDIDYMRGHEHYFTEANKAMPNFYVVSAATRTLFQYDTKGETGSYRSVGQVNSYKDLLKFIKE